MVGGRALTNGPLNYLLRNRMYLGEINHRDKSYPGEHERDPRRCSSSMPSRPSSTRTVGAARERHQNSKALLLGKLFDDRGNPMTPSYAIKKGVRYRYYVSCVLAQGRKEDAGTVKRVAATEMERIVWRRSRRLSRGGLLRRQRHRDRRNGPATTPLRSSRRSTTNEAARERIERVTLFAQSIDIELRTKRCRPCGARIDPLDASNLPAQARSDRAHVTRPARPTTDAIGIQDAACIGDCSRATMAR